MCDRSHPPARSAKKRWFCAHAATLVLTGVVASSVGACTPAPELGPAKTDGLDDTFEGSTVSKTWTPMNADTFSAEVAKGELSIVPNRNVVWWKADQGPGLFKKVSGNFHVSTAVKARSAKDPSKPVDSGYQFGGIIARSPASDTSGEENYVFNVVGYRGDYLSAETKTTKDDESEVEGPKWDSGDAELRICRHNGKFLILNRPIGGKKWTLAITYERNDLPAELQVGPIAYTYTDAWDLRASFDYVKFGSVTRVEDCHAP